MGSWYPWADGLELCLRPVDMEPQFWRLFVEEWRSIFQLVEEICEHYDIVTGIEVCIWPETIIVHTVNQ